MEELSRIDKIISCLNRDTWEKSLGMILLLSEYEQDLLFEEVDYGSVDIRFGDNLICAISKWKEMVAKGILN